MENETKSYGIELECWGTCNHDDCDEVLPMDMDAIAINSSNVFCSPACARDFLDSTTEEVEYIILHDSQRVLDAAVFSHHTDDGDILMFVDGIEEARITVDEIGENFPHEFRPKL